MHIERGFIVGFKHAIDGFRWATKTQINMRIHLIAVLFVVLLGIFLKINYLEWFVVITVIFTTIVLELVNTSIEQTTNAITAEFNPFVKRAKDVSAAAVLVYAVYAGLIGLLIFGGKL